MIPLNDDENMYYKMQGLLYIQKKINTNKMIKMHLIYTIKSEIVVITRENLEKLLIVSAI